MATDCEHKPNILETMAEVHVHDLSESRPDHAGQCEGGENSARPSSRKNCGQIEIIFRQDHRINCGSLSENENQNEEIKSENETLYALIEKLQANYDSEKLLSSKLSQEIESCKNTAEIRDTEHSVRISELSDKISEDVSIIAKLQNKINDITDVNEERRDSQIHELHNMKNQCKMEIQELLQQLEETRHNEKILKSQIAKENNCVDNFKEEIKGLHEKIEENENFTNIMLANLDRVKMERDSALQRALQLEDALRDSCAELRDKLWLSSESFDEINNRAQTLEVELKIQHAANENQRSSIEQLDVELRSATERVRSSEHQITELQDRSKHREKDLLDEITELKQECNKYIEQLELARREAHELQEMSAKGEKSTRTQNSIIINELNAKILELKKMNKALTNELKDMIKERCNSSQHPTANFQAEISELKEKYSEKESILSKLANTQNILENKYREWIADKKSPTSDREVNEINDLKLKLEGTETGLKDMANELSSLKSKYDRNRKRLENCRNEIKEKDQYLQAMNIENVALKLELDSYRQNYSNSEPISYKVASDKRVASVKSTKSRRKSSRADCYSSVSQSSILTRRHSQSDRRRWPRHRPDIDSSTAESVVEERTKITTLYVSPRDILPLSVRFAREKRGVMSVVVNKIL